MTQITFFVGVDMASASFMHGVCRNCAVEAHGETSQIR
jgi:hypothetical protein